MRQGLLQYAQSSVTGNTLISEICASILVAETTPKEELLNLIAITLLLHELSLELIDCASAGTDTDPRTSQSIRQRANDHLHLFIQSTIGYPQPSTPKPPSKTSAYSSPIIQNTKSRSTTSKTPTPQRNFRNHLKVPNYYRIN
jgi:hypothetical protein